jgi:putative membrane protein
MKYFLLILWILLVAAGTAFAILNHQVINLHFYFKNLDAHLTSIMGICLLIGFLFGLLLGLPVWIHQRRKYRRLRERVKELEIEVGRLRVIPIKEVTP